MTTTAETEDSSARPKGRWIGEYAVGGVKSQGLVLRVASAAGAHATRRMVGRLMEMAGKEEPVRPPRKLCSIHEIRSYLPERY